MSKSSHNLSSKSWLPLLLILLISITLVSCAKHEIRNKYNVSQATLSHDGSVEKLISALDDPKPKIRRWAAVYLWKTGPSAQPALPKLTAVAHNDSDSGVRTRALTAIKNIDPEYHRQNFTLQGTESRSAEDLALLHSEKLQQGMVPTSDGLIEIDLEKDGERIIFKLTPQFFYDNGYVNNTHPVSRYGLIPVLFQITNTSTTSIKFDKNNFTIYNLKNIKKEPLTADIVNKKMEYSMKKGVTTAVLLGPFGLGSPFKVGKANNLISKKTNSNILKNEEIEPLTNTSGYLYYEVPKNIKHINDYKIEFSFATDKNIKYVISYSFDGFYRLEKASYAHTPNAIKTDTEKKLLSLKNLYERELITEKEYTSMREEILDNF